MSATIPNPIQTLNSPDHLLSYSHYPHLAINTKIKRLHSSLDPYGSSGLPPTKAIKTANPFTLLTSPPLKKNHSLNSANVFSQKQNYIQKEKFSSVLAPKSTSSQPNKIFDYQSPQYQDSIDSEGLPYSELEARNYIFTPGFYKRIEEFLDNEGLYIADTTDFNRVNIRQGRKLFLKLKEFEGIMEEGQDRGDSSQADNGRSASCHSPQLISESITSKLFQRRVSHSQAPVKGLFIPDQDSLLLKTKLSRINSKIRSPIMEIERDSPYSFRTPKKCSRKSSQFGTPASVKRTQNSDSSKKLLKLRAVSKGSSPTLPESIKNIPSLKGAQSVHGNLHGSFFKIQGDI